MKNFLKKTRLIDGLLAFSAVTLSGCAQTDVIFENEQTEEAGEFITFNISAPKDLTTRADSDHKLRFTAKLFKERYDGMNGVQFLEKKQGIATDGECTIVFSVPEGDYSVLLFADYIPNNTNADSQGFYADAYYDTSSTNEDITMIAFTANDNNATLLQKNNINNDNYDCFSAKVELIHKTEAEYKTDVTLKRAVCKVIYKSTTPLASGIKSIELKNFYYFDQFKQFYETVFHLKSDNDMRLSSHILNGMADQANQELFYFYTLASPRSTEPIGLINFDVNFQDGSTRNINIPSGTVTPLQNYIITVQGAFLSDPIDSKGDIILNLDRDDQWGTNSNIFTD